MNSDKILIDRDVVDSCDYRPGDENKAILACLHPGATLEAAVETAETALRELTAELAKAREGKK